MRTIPVKVKPVIINGRDVTAGAVAMSLNDKDPVTTGFTLAQKRQPSAFKKIPGAKGDKDIFS